MLSNTWKKSSKSGPYSDNCVEARLVDGTIEVRNSLRPEAGSVTFNKDEWTAFLDGAEEFRV